mmetsp:Transcript_13649/g.24020  ORF Transcript_13649/g.24020 Transcript_13649/m.24020 type:complete len:91 (-) Transcript_13649:71-343(-)
MHASDECREGHNQRDNNMAHGSKPGNDENTRCRGEVHNQTSQRAPRRDRPTQDKKRQAAHNSKEAYQQRIVREQFRAGSAMHLNERREWT